MTYCSSCGEKIEGDSNFCTKCGKDLISKSEQGTQPTGNFDTEKVKGMITKLKDQFKENKKFRLGTIGIGIIIILLFVFLGNYSSSEKKAIKATEVFLEQGALENEVKLEIKDTSARLVKEENKISGEKGIYKVHGYASSQEEGESREVIEFTVDVNFFDGQFYVTDNAEVDELEPGDKGYF